MTIITIFSQMIVALGTDAKLPTNPYEIEPSKFAAELTTADTGIFGSIAGKGVQQEIFLREDSKLEM